MTSNFEAMVNEFRCSKPTHHRSFIFHLENILRSYLNFSTSYGSLTDLKPLLDLLFVSFIWLGENFEFFLMLTFGGHCVYRIVQTYYQRKTVVIYIWPYKDYEYKVQQHDSSKTLHYSHCFLSSERFNDKKFLIII